MALYADANCVLKVNVNCEACQMKTVEILNSIVGVYSVTIDAEAGLAKIYGEVDPNILLKAIARSGRHAELVRVNIKHPQMNRDRSYDHGLLESSYGPRYRRTLPDSSYRNEYYPMTTDVPVPDYPFNCTNYHCRTPPPATWVPSYSPRDQYNPYDDDRTNCCTIM